MNENKKLDVKHFMGPSRVLVYRVENLSTGEVVFKDYIYEPCMKVRNKFNKNKEEKKYKVKVDFEETEFTEIYDEDFITEDDIMEKL